MSGRKRYGLLLLAVMLSLGVQGFAGEGDLQKVVVTALAGTTLLLALQAAQIPDRLIVLAGTLAAAALALSVVQAAGDGGQGATLVMNAAVLALAPPAIALGVIRDVRETDQVRLDAVLGVLTLYMLLGMAFSFVYGAMDQLGSDPFFADGQTATVSHCLYFSFTTLTTVGYGDFVAATDPGHTVAVFEALIGQIYLVTVVSLLVSNLGRPARRQRTPARS